MIKLKLIRGRSYRGRGVVATAAKPFVEVDNRVISDYLVKTKRFVPVQTEIPEPADDFDETDDDFDDLDETEEDFDGESTQNDEEQVVIPEGVPSARWSFAQLRAYAEAKAINVEGLRSRAQLAAKIKEAGEV